MKKILFDAEFEKRLVNLHRVLSIYLIERKDCGLSPALFSVLSACWSMKIHRLSSPRSVSDCPDILISDDLPF